MWSCDVDEERSGVVESVSRWVRCVWWICLDKDAREKMQKKGERRWKIMFLGEKTKAAEGAQRGFLYPVLCNKKGKSSRGAVYSNSCWLGGRSFLAALDIQEGSNNNNNNNIRHEDDRSLLLWVWKKATTTTSWCWLLVLLVLCSIETGRDLGDLRERGRYNSCFPIPRVWGIEDFLRIQDQDLDNLGSSRRYHSYNTNPFIPRVLWMIDWWMECPQSTRLHKTGSSSYITETATEKIWSMP